MNIVYLADHPKFIPTVARWVHDEWSYLHPERTLADVEWMVHARAVKGRIPIALVALDGGEPVGTVCIKINDMDTHPDWTPWLACLIVIKERRREGIGAELVRALEAEAAAQGIKKLYLFTPDAESFYTKLGWQTIAREPYHGTDVIVMAKLIPR